MLRGARALRLAFQLGVPRGELVYPTSRWQGLSMGVAVLGTPSMGGVISYVRACVRTYGVS